MATEGLRFVRRDRLKLAGFGLMTGFGPLLLAGGLLIAFPSIVWTWIGASIAIFFAGRNALAALKIVDLIEMRGTTVRFRRLWTKCWVEVSQAMTMRIVLWMAVKEPSEPGVGGRARISPQGYLAFFSNGKRLFVPFPAFPGSEAVITLLAAPADLGLRFPLRGHSLYLNDMTVYPEPGLGRSWSYYKEDGEKGTVTVYLYHKNLNGIPQGVSPVVQNEFAEAEKDIFKVSQVTPGPGTVRHLGDTRIVPGADPNLEFLCGEYQIEAANDRRISRLYLTGYADHFLKIRITAPVEDMGFSSVCDRTLNMIAEAAGSSTEQLVNS